jgi:signal transduction histidine kinase
MSIRFQLFNAFFALILIFSINFYINKRLSNDVIKNISYLSNSETVIRNSNVLQKNIIEMQSGFRGFLLTGQEVFLQPYYEGIKNIPILLKELNSLVPLQQNEKLDSINVLHQLWLNYANGLIATKLDTLPEASKKYIELFETKLRMEVGKKLNDKIQVLFLNFYDYEYQLRQERKTALEKSLKNTRDMNLALTLISIFLAMLSSFYFTKIITSRISKMVTLAEKISNGDFKTIEDTKKDELNSLSVSLNSMSQTLEKNFKELTKKNKELDQFAYVVSHDLKAPLRGITNLIAWIEEDHQKDITPEIKYNLDLIKGRVVRLENMINGLLEYARIGRVKKEFVIVDVSNLLNEIIDILVPKNYKIYIEGEMPILTTEKLALEQVFSNLISNAVKYNNKEDRQIIIRSKELSDYYEFSVTDNGIGIESEYFEKVFQIFQTLQESDEFESTGVGLAIVKKIIDDHKSSIDVKSKIGEGSAFIFTWPKSLKNLKK